MTKRIEHTLRRDELIDLLYKSNCFPGNVNSADILLYLTPRDELKISLPFPEGEETPLGEHTKK